MSASKPPKADATGLLLDRVLRGARSAQRDAERIASELLRDGHIDEEEARAALDAVGRALEEQVSRIDRDWLAPLASRASGWLRGQPDSGSETEARLAAIEVRLAELERRVVDDPED